MSAEQLEVGDKVIFVSYHPQGHSRWMDQPCAILDGTITATHQDKYEDAIVVCTIQYQGSSPLDFYDQNVLAEHILSVQKKDLATCCSKHI